MERREQNKMVREFDAIKEIVGQIEPFIVAVALRATHDNGARRSPKIKSGSRNSEIGTPPTYYSDPTGETAVRDRMADTVESNVRAIHKHLLQALNLVKNVMDVTPSDVAERARRQVPDCLACGEPVAGRVKSGYCKDCYKAWSDGGFRDRHTFEVRRKVLTQDDANQEWRIDAIDHLQQTGALPL